MTNITMANTVTGHVRAAASVRLLLAPTSGILGAEVCPQSAQRMTGALLGMPKAAFLDNAYVDNALVRRAGDPNPFRQFVKHSLGSSVWRPPV
jgi:hypothetical protein